VDDRKNKSPEELGEAVGKKIEELFGGMFADDIPQRGSLTTSTVVSPGIPSQFPLDSGADEPRTEWKTTSPPAAKTQESWSLDVPSQPRREVPQRSSFQDIIDRIDALIYHLEWEASPESVIEISEKLNEIEAYLPSTGPAKTILAMNRRILPRYSTPDSVPHPAFIKLLRDSIDAFKTVNESNGSKQPSQYLISQISAGYKSISNNVSPPLKVAGPENGKSSGKIMGLMTEFGGAIRLIEEVSRRLSRNLGTLRQGGVLSGEEITRRLGTIEHLLTERIGKLTSLHSQLAEVAQSESLGSNEFTAQSVPPQLVLMVWAGIPLAASNSIIAGIYPVSAQQVDQFVTKEIVTLGMTNIKRLHIKRPKGTEGIKPAWLVHFCSGEKNFFLLPEKLAGIRKPPEGCDPLRDPRVKIGPTVYNIIYPAILK
jgi:hypothetical protein